MKIEKKNVYWVVGALIVSFGIVGATKFYDYYNNNPVVEQKSSKEYTTSVAKDQGLEQANTSEDKGLEITEDMHTAIEDNTKRMFICEILGSMSEEDSEKYEEILLRINFVRIDENGKDMVFHLTKDYLAKMKIELMNTFNSREGYDTMSRTQEIYSFCMTTRNTSNLLIKTIKQYNGE